MLPTKVFQLDYQDFSTLVWNHIPKIEEYNEIHNIQYDMVVAKLRNGVIAGSILSTYFGIPLGVIEAPRGLNFEQFRFFNEEHIKGKNPAKILLVDSIVGTGATIQDLKAFFNAKYPEVHVTTYVTLVDNNSKIKPDIIGELKKEYIQTPWEWRSFTPQSHLERLEAGHIKAAIEQDIFVAFSSEECKNNLENSLGKLIESEWTKVFFSATRDQKIIKATSGISSFNIEKKINFAEYRTKFKTLIEEKVEFILSNGVSHYIEDNLEQAVLVAQKCPVTHIFFFDGNKLHKIYSKPAEFQQFKF